jgi:PIN domain nuclease of toxin-antitoxin system
MGARRLEIPRQTPTLILLDTNVLIWVEQTHRRVRRLLAVERKFYISPANILELQFLVETGRIRLRSGVVASFIDDDRWVLDEPPATAWFVRALNLSWTRDPFDRLIAAHVLYRGWRLATADGDLLQHLGPSHSIEL